MLARYRYFYVKLYFFSVYFKAIFTLANDFLRIMAILTFVSVPFEDNGLGNVRAEFVLSFSVRSDTVSLSRYSFVKLWNQETLII